MVSLAESRGDDEGFCSRGGSPADDAVAGLGRREQSCSRGRCVRRCAGTPRPRVRWRRSGGDRPARVSSFADAQALHLRLSQPQSSRRLEREAGRNLEVMWLTGRLVPDHKTIADFRKDNGPAIKKVCARFVELCRKMGLLAKASVAVDGSKFKAVNSRDNNFTQGKIKRRQKQIE